MATGEFPERLGYTEAQSWGRCSQTEPHSHDSQTRMPESTGELYENPAAQVAPVGVKSECLGVRARHQVFCLLFKSPGVSSTQQELGVSAFELAWQGFCGACTAPGKAPLPEADPVLLFTVFWGSGCYPAGSEDNYKEL